MVHKTSLATATAIALLAVVFLPPATAAAGAPGDGLVPAAPVSSAAGCIPVSDAKDFTVRVCEGAPEECRLFVERTTKTGTERDCLVPAATATATTECYAIASRHDVGPVTVIQHSSCSYTIVVAVNGDLEAAEKLGISTDCPAYYKETPLGPATLVQGGCGAALILHMGPGALASLGELVAVQGPNVVWEPWCIPVGPRLYDADWLVCVDPDGPCYLSEVRERPGGHQTFCALNQPSVLEPDGPLGGGNPALRAPEDLLRPAAAPKLFPEYAVTVGPCAAGYSFFPDTEHVRAGCAGLFGVAAGPTFGGPTCRVGVLTVSADPCSRDTLEDLRDLVELPGSAAAGPDVPEHGVSVTTAPPCVGYNPSYWSDAGWTWCANPQGPCYVKETANTIAGPRERCVVGPQGEPMAGAAWAPGKQCTPPIVGPDIWIEYCLYPSGPCVFGREGYSPSGDATKCYVERPVAESMAASDRCVRSYFSETVGPVTVVVPDTCTVVVHVTTSGGCADRYERLDLGVVRYESTDTCNYDVRADARALQG